MSKKNTTAQNEFENENDYQSADASRWDEFDDQIDDLVGLDFVDQIDLDF